MAKKIGTTYKYGRETVELIKIDVTDNAVFCMLKREDGSTFSVGSKIIDRDMKEIK